VSSHKKNIQHISWSDSDRYICSVDINGVASGWNVLGDKPVFDYSNTNWRLEQIFYDEKRDLVILLSHDSKIRVLKEKCSILDYELQHLDDFFTCMLLV
jgi:WD40 repeat protein